MTPQDANLLKKLTLIAQKIVYEPKRMDKFMQMLGTKQGAVQAVHTVITVITKMAKVPEALIPQLSVNIYMAMVDMAQEITGKKANLQVLREVIKQFNNTPQVAPKPASPPPQSQGIIGQKMGAPA